MTLIFNLAWLAAHRLRMGFFLGLFRRWEAAGAAARAVVLGLRSPARVSMLLAGLLAVGGPTYKLVTERQEHRSVESNLVVENLKLRTERNMLQNSLIELVNQRARLEQELLDAGLAVLADGEIKVRVTATGYSSSPLETDSTPFTTAFNTLTRPGVIALSRDLIRSYNPGAPFDFGDRVLLEGIGEFIVEDSMHSRWRRRADIWFPSRIEALRFGRKVTCLAKPLLTSTLEGSPSSPTEENSF